MLPVWLLKVQKNTHSEQQRRFVSPYIIRFGRLLFSYQRKKKTPIEVNRILFFKLGAIGDVLMTTSLVRSVRLRFPTAQLHYMTGMWSAPALQNNPDIQRILVFSDHVQLGPLFVSIFRTMAPLLMHRYDLVFVLDKAWEAGVLIAPIARYSIGFDRYGEGFALSSTVPYGLELHNDAPHDIATYVSLMDSLGRIPVDAKMVFIPSTSDEKFAMSILSSYHAPYIALCPGGARNPYQRMDGRRWNIKRYAKLARRLLERGYTVVLLGSADDRTVALSIMAYCMKEAVDTSRLVDLIGKTTLGQCAAVLKYCMKAVCHDTALMHLASAMHTRVIALFGPTNPKRKEPRNTGSVTIWDSSRCSHCHQEVCHWDHTSLPIKCGARMDRIRVSDVYNLISKDLHI